MDVLDNEAVGANDQLRLTHVGVVQQMQILHLLLGHGAVEMHTEHLNAARPTTTNSIALSRMLCVFYALEKRASAFLFVHVLSQTKAREFYLVDNEERHTWR